MEEHSPFRLIVVSNRGPYNLQETKQGIKREKSIGGLVSSILPMMEKFGGVWIAAGEPAGRYTIAPAHPRFELYHLHLTPEQIRGYYHGLSNSALWPLCHYFLGQAVYDREQWEIYRQVNQHFAQAALQEARDDDLIWVQDYHLALVPQFLRQARPAARIAHFWHIPFPPQEVFRTLPWRRLLLEGLLSSDVIGFHIPEYAENFLETAQELLGAQVEDGALLYNGWRTQVLARPIGIDYETIDRIARSPTTERRVGQLRALWSGQNIILGVERLDYTKGILERLRALELLLEHRPDLHGRVALIQIVTPSREKVGAYRRNKREIDETVGRINGRFSDGIWVPIHYLYRSYSLSQLIAYYRVADIALVTPLRDGLNLVAKEYVAARVQADGLLVLSEFAGAARQLSGALIVNPYNIEAMAETLAQGLAMSKEEQCARMQAMQARIKEQDVSWWANEFLERMKQINH